MDKHYDVAILGGGIGALAAAALLARRSWRVLVLGHGYRPPVYRHDSFSLARRPFTFLCQSSPAWLRILIELAQSQTFRRKVGPLDPMFQVLGPRIRLDLPPDGVLFTKEIDREFPEVRRVVDELYAELARVNATVDAAFERDVVWPPGGFWERRETDRVVETLPFLGPRGRDPLGEFPREHVYREVVAAPARFSSNLVLPLPALALARLHGAWTRGPSSLPGGEEELVEFLSERVRAHGGETLLNERAVSITHRRGKVNGVLIDGNDQPTGVQFLVTDRTVFELLDKTESFVPSRRAMAQIPRLVPLEHRFCLSVVVRNEGIPSALAPEAFSIIGGGDSRAESSPIPIHLQLAPESASPPGTRLLIVEALFPVESNSALGQARETVLGIVEEYLPFMERHIVMVDSPHDGRPLWDYRAGGRKEVDRSLLRTGGGTLEAEPMLAQWRVDPSVFYNLGGEPLRSPLKGAFLVGRSVLPALGQEGELLAAWSAARTITRTDIRKEKMRREMWTNVEV